MSLYCLMQKLLMKDCTNNFKKSGKKEKTCDKFFNSFNLWYDKEEKTNMFCCYKSNQ